jgi:lysozyme
MTTDLQAMIMSQEGTGPMHNGRFFPYVDTVGKTTIGFGRNLDAKGLSADEAQILLNADLADAIEDVRHVFSCYDQLSRPRQLVLLSMAYNLGRVGLGKWPRFISAVHLGKYDEAADHLLDSLAAKQAAGRYRQLAEMMRTDTSEWV